MAQYCRAVMARSDGASGTARNIKRNRDMSLATRIEQLQKRHGELERKIDDARNHPSVDPLEITDLKRRKLRIKDEISKLEEPTSH